MPDTSAFLDLPYLQPSQAQKHVTHNEALRRLDWLVQLSVETLDQAAPPEPATEGSRYIVGAGASGAWAGKDGQIAVFEGGAWHFIEPASGWLAHLREAGVLAAFNGTEWERLQPETLAVLGVNATADAANRLSVSSEGSLFNHEGAGHRLAINKAGAADTASMIFQSGFAGRAEMGLAGDDDFSIKVSADGVSWNTALQVDAATGAATTGALAAAAYGGAGVQSSSIDKTAGRVLKLDGDTGSFGLGGVTSPFLADVNDPACATGFYRTTSGSAGTFPPGANKFGQLIVFRYNGDGFNQIYADVVSPTCWVRSFRQQSGGFGAWVKGYHSGNIVGPVAQTAGVPSGAVLEHVSTATGRALRLAEGTQVLSADLVLNRAGPGLLEATWSFPAATVGAARLIAVARWS
ncbi:DUF2793 domain-containing protein [Roseovarius sp. S4756]|uniref:DUF2793 domain-containing protein n=1 Tax=Roseovarius maritimus TaxID=3342637 RepID=UPI0037282F05